MGDHPGNKQARIKALRSSFEAASAERDARHPEVRPPRSEVRASEAFRDYQSGVPGIMDSGFGWQVQILPVDRLMRYDRVFIYRNLTERKVEGVTGFDETGTPITEEFDLSENTELPSFRGLLIPAGILKMLADRLNPREDQPAQKIIDMYERDLAFERSRVDGLFMAIAGALGSQYERKVTDDEEARQAGAPEFPDPFRT
jgi:hypothetical protein